jgi:hypothetical protein
MLMRRLSDESGEMTALNVGPISAFSTFPNRSSDVFILDNVTEVFVWVSQPLTQAATLVTT